MQHNATGTKKLLSNYNQELHDLSNDKIMKVPLLPW